MTDHDLRDLLHDHVADVATTDLSSGAWSRGRTTRRRRATATVLAGGVAVAAVVVGIVAVGGSDPQPEFTAPTSTPTDAVSVTKAPVRPTTSAPRPYSSDLGRRPDTTVDGSAVYFSPTPDQELGLPQADDAPVPATIDLNDPAPSVEEDPVRRVEAAFVVTAADGTRTAVLVAPDGSHRSLDLGPAGDFTPSPFLVSPLGTRLLFPRADALAVYDLTTHRWHQVDTGGRSTDYLDWQGNDVLLYPSPGDGPAIVCYVDDDRCSGGSNPYARPAVDGLGGAQGYGRTRAGQSGPTAQAGEGGSVPAAAGTPTGGSFLDLGQGDDLLVQSGTREKGCCGLQTWLSPDQVVYQGGTDGAVVLAWTVGTHTFERVTTIVGAPAGADVVMSTPRWDLGDSAPR